MSALYKLIRQLARRECGCSTGEIQAAYPASIRKIGKACGDLARRSELVTLRISHKNARYFATLELMQGYRATLFNKPVARPGTKVSGSPWGPDTQAVTPPHVKVQVGPSHPPRFEAIEFPFIHQRKGL